MARLRKGVSYRKLERPYTRVSKFKARAYVKARPPSKVIRYAMGQANKRYDKTLNLVSKDALQVRHNSIESARMSSNRLLENVVGKDNFYFLIRMYPHHILRENPLASGAGADRMSTGMAHSFGKPIGRAAQISIGQTIMTLKLDKAHEAIGRKALKRAAYKMPCRITIEVVRNK